MLRYNPEVGGVCAAYWVGLEGSNDGQVLFV
jgi:hypothetical protein